MKISELPEKYKIYKINMSSKNSYFIDGSMLENILNSQGTFFRLPDGTGFNKSFLIDWSLDIEQTRQKVGENKEELLKIETAKKLP